MNNLTNQFSKSNLTNLILIGCNILNITGNNLLENYKKIKNNNYFILGKKLFIISLVITLIVYVFFVNNNYKNVKILKRLNKDVTPSVVRLIGSFLFVIGILCFIYYQVNENELTTSPET